MKYGIMGGFVRLAFAKKAFDYIEKELPEIDTRSYKRRVLKEYKAIVKRTPGIGSMKNNMFVVTMYAGAFLIALYKEADEKLKDEKLLHVLRRSFRAPPIFFKKSLRHQSIFNLRLYHHNQERKDGDTYEKTYLGDLLYVCAHRLYCFYRARYFRFERGV